MNKATEHAQIETDLLNVSEAAKFLRLRPSTIRAWVLRRQVRFVKLGGRVLFRRGDLERLIATSEVPAKSEKLTKVAA